MSTTNGARRVDPAKRNLHDRIDAEFALLPVGAEAQTVLDSLRRTYKDVAHILVELTPPSREQSLALTELDSSLRWGVAALVRHPEPT